MAEKPWSQFAKREQKSSQEKHRSGPEREVSWPHATPLELIRVVAPEFCSDLMPRKHNAGKRKAKCKAASKKAGRPRKQGEQSPHFCALF